MMIIEHFGKSSSLSSLWNVRFIYLCFDNCHAWIDILLRVMRPNRLVLCSIAVCACVCKIRITQWDQIEWNGDWRQIVLLFVSTYNSCHTTGRIESIQLTQCNHITLFIVLIEYHLFIGIGQMQQSASIIVQSICICRTCTSVSLVKLKIENLVDLLKFNLQLIRSNMFESFHAQWLDCIQHDQYICYNNRCHHRMSLHSLWQSMYISKWKSFKRKLANELSCAHWEILMTMRPFGRFHNVWLMTIDSCFL